MNIKTKDKIVKDVLIKMDNRSVEGNIKYGGTMHSEITENKKNLMDFVVDVQEELMDALLYLESVKTILKNENI